MQPDLEPQFLQPNGWQWGEYERMQGRRLRFGYAIPDNPKAIVVFLPGLSEFCEKHFETVNWALKNDYGVFMIDWFGQGKSGRYLDNPHKRHAANFQEDIDDLAFWIEHHIQPKVTAPLIMLSLSMGANIGLHYIHQYPQIFAASCFTAPMFGIKTMRHIPFSKKIAKIMDKFASDSYVPGGGDWRKGMHPSPSLSILTKDPVRNPIHNAWSLKDPGLQIGGVTFGWVYEAHKSCLKLKEISLEEVQTPCFIACMQHEMLVDNKVNRKICHRLPNAKLIMLADSWHEPLMERDHIRNHLLDLFKNFIRDHLNEAQ